MQAVRRAARYRASTTAGVPARAPIFCLTDIPEDADAEMLGILARGKAIDQRHPLNDLSPDANAEIPGPNSSAFTGQQCSLPKFCTKVPQARPLVRALLSRFLLPLPRPLDKSMPSYSRFISIPYWELNSAPYPSLPPTFYWALCLGATPSGSMPWGYTIRLCLVSIPAPYSPPYRLHIASISAPYQLRIGSLKALYRFHIAPYPLYIGSVSAPYRPCAGSVSALYRLR